MRKKQSCFLYCLLLVFCLLLQGCGAGKQAVETEEIKTTTEQETETEPPGTMKDDGVCWQDFVADMGMGWNLGNTFDSIDCDWVSNELDYEAAWVPGGPKTTKEMIQLVKDQGFRTIRIPVSWHNHVDITTDENGEKRYTISEQWMKRVKEVVDYCMDEGLYVVINIHHDDEDKNFIYPTEEYREQSIGYITQIWTQVATEFADYDLHLIYEVYNEVRLAGTDDQWTPDTPAAVEAQLIMNDYTQAGVDAIRSVAKGYNESRFIMCTGYAGNLYSYKNQVLPTDKGGYPNRIMVSTHPYVPSSFCMDVSENGKSVFDEQVQVSVKEVFRVIDREWTSKDVPVVISEWGTIMKPDNAEERIKHAAYYVKQAVTACKDSSGKTVQIPCILWDNGTLGDLTKGETFGFLDRQNLRWFDQGYVDAIIAASNGEEVDLSVISTAYSKNGNGLENGDFADGINGFEVYSFVPEDVSYEVKDGEGFRIDISDTSEEDWHIQLKQGDIKLQQGKWYQLTLDAKSDLGRSIICSMQRDGTNDNNWTSYSGAQNLALTKQWKTYKITFQMTEKTDEHAIFNLAMGAVDGKRIKTKHTIGIKNIKLEPLADNWMDRLAEGDNLLKNADFAYDGILWESFAAAPGKAKTTFANGEAVLDINNTGDADWHVQLKQGGVRLEQNKWYQITLDAKSSLGRSILCSMQRDGTNDNNWTSYSGARNLALTEQWKTYKITFQMTENTDERAIFNLSMGAVDGNMIKTNHTVEIKNARLEPLQDNWMDQLAVDGNLLKNADFAYDGILWDPFAAAPGEARTTFADGEAIVDISNTGDADWHIQLKQGGVRLEQNKWYQITLDAKSSLSRSILCSMQRDGTDDDNWLSYSGARNLALTEQWKTYKITFQMTENTDERAIFNLSMGAVDGSIISTNHTVGIKNVKLEPLADNWMDQLTEGTNILKNPKFKYDDIAWSASAVEPGAAAIKFENGKAIFDISNVGTADWHVQLKQNPIKLEYGYNYRLTFKASSTASRSISIGFMDKDYVQWYGGNMEFLEAGAERTVAVDFYMDKATNNEANMFISMGKIENRNTPASVITLSDFLLVKLPGGPVSSSGGEGYKWTTPVVHFKDGWSLYYWHGKIGKCRETEPGEYHIEIRDTGSKDWHVQMQKKRIKLENGKNYRMSFEAKSTVDRDISCVIQKDGSSDGDWTLYSGDGGQYQLGSDWQTFTCDFTMTSPSDEKAIFNISLGQVDRRIKSLHTVCIRNIKLVDIDSLPIESVPVGQEMLTGKWTFNNPLSGNTITEDNGKFTADIKDVGTNHYDVQIKQTGLTLEKGCTYEFKCNAGFSNGQRIIKVDIMNPNNDYDWYGGQDLTIGTPQQTRVNTTEREYAFTFTVAEDKPTIRSGMLAISMGKVGDDTPTGIVTIDHLSLKKIEKTDTPDDPDTNLIADTEGNMLKGMEFNVTPPAKATQKGTEFAIENLGEQDYHIQLKHKGDLKLEKGATYEFTADTGFAAKEGETDSTREINIGFMSKLYDWYGGDKTKLTGSDGKISVKFTMEKDTDENAIFTISMGQMREGDAESAKVSTPLGTITLSNLCLKKTKDAPEESDEKLIADTEGNMLKGMEFNVTPPAKAIQKGTEFAIENLGEQDYHIQLKHTEGLKLEKGATYEFTADADFAAKKGETHSTREINIGFMSKSYDWYGGDKTKLPGSDGKISVKFTMEKDTDENAIFTISMGQMREGDAESAKVSTPLGTITLSNLCLKKTKDAPEESDDKLIADTEGNMLKGMELNVTPPAKAMQKGTKFTVENLGEQDYHIQLKHTEGLKLEKGAEYEFTADAGFTAKEGETGDTRKISIGFMSADYVWYGGEKPEIPSSDGKISVKFTMGENTDENAVFTISMGQIREGDAESAKVSTPLGTITLSNLCLKKTKDAPEESNEKLIADTEGNMLKEMEFNADPAKATQKGTEFTIENLGEQDYEIQLKHKGELKLEKGAEYEFTADAGFTAKEGETGSTRQINIGFMSADYNWYGGDKPELTGSDGKISVKFTMEKDTDENAVFTISMGQIREGGADSETVPTPLGTITLSNLCLKKTKDAPEESNEKLIADTEGNMLALASCETSVDTANGATATFNDDKTKVEITNLGSLGNWQISLAQYGLNLEQNHKYRFTGKIACDANRTVYAVIGKNSDPYTTYSKNDNEDDKGWVVFTDDMREFEIDVTFTMAEADAQARFMVSMGRFTNEGAENPTDKHIVTLSDFALVDVTDPQPEAPANLFAVGDNNLLTKSTEALDTSNMTNTEKNDANTQFIISALDDSTGNGWKVSIAKKVDLEEGHKYRFTGKVYSSTTRKIEAQIQLNGNPWTVYGGGGIDCTAGRTENVNTEFTYNESSNTTPIRFFVGMGKVAENDAPGTIQLSDFSLIDITDENSNNASSDENTLSLEDEPEAAPSESVTPEDDTEKTLDNDETDEADETAEDAEDGEDKKEDNHAPDNAALMPDTEDETKEDTEKEPESDKTTENSDEPEPETTEENETVVEQKEQAD